MSNGSNHNTSGDEDSSQPSNITLTHSDRDRAIKGEPFPRPCADDDEEKNKRDNAEIAAAKKKVEEHADEQHRILRESRVAISPIDPKPGKPGTLGGDGGMGDI